MAVQDAHGDAGRGPPDPRCARVANESATRHIPPKRLEAVNGRRSPNARGRGALEALARHEHDATTETLTDGPDDDGPPRSTSPRSVYETDIQREERGVQKSIKDCAKRDDLRSMRLLAKEIVASRRTVARLHENKAQMNSVQPCYPRGWTKWDRITIEAESLSYMKLIERIEDMSGCTVNALYPKSNACTLFHKSESYDTADFVSNTIDVVCIC